MLGYSYLAERLLYGVVQELLRERNPKPSMMDDFDYVMHGKVYKLDREKFRGQDNMHGSIRTQVYISFGGLLCCLTADHENLQSFELDSMVYLLVRSL
jgi:DNA-directed RNA polymerases I, II, and III subunit RPABC3